MKLHKFHIAQQRPHGSRCEAAGRHWRVRRLAISQPAGCNQCCRRGSNDVHFFLHKSDASHTSVLDDQFLNERNATTRTRATTGRAPTGRMIARRIASAWHSSWL